MAQTVAAPLGNTCVLVSSSASTAVCGQSVTYTANIANTSGTGLTPTGTVQFIVNGADLGAPVALNAAGQATCPAISFPMGADRTVEAIYSGDSNFTGGNGSMVQVVQSVAVEPDPSFPALTDLFVGNGAMSDDSIQVTAAGTSTTGCTGVQLISTLSGVQCSTTFGQSFNAVCLFEGNGDDTFQMDSGLTIGAHITAGNGKDCFTLGQGNNLVTPTGSDNGERTPDGQYLHPCVGDGASDAINLGNGCNRVSAGNGNDAITLGNGCYNSVTTGSGIDNVCMGNGSYNAVTLGDGNDNFTAGSGSADVLNCGQGRYNVKTIVGWTIC